jgi:hypothetical protein
MGKTIRVFESLATSAMLDIAARADPREGIRQGLEESRLGRGRDAEEFFAEFEASHGIPRQILPRAERDL